MAWLLYAGLALISWTAWTLVSLQRNYRAARSINLPIVISPINPWSMWWLVACSAFPSIRALIQYLPFRLGRWSKYAYTGWMYDDAGAVHAELGPAFVLCTPGLNEVILADPGAVKSVLSRRKEFRKPAVLYDHLNVFGRNVDAVEGEAWQRQRRLTAPSLNENVSSTVWAESLRQAGEMLEGWVKRGSEGTRQVSADTATLALNVWTKAGFGIQYPFKDAEHILEKGHEASYRDTLRVVLAGFTTLTVLPMDWLRKSFMPEKLQQLGKACDELKLYMREIVEREKTAAAERTTDGGTLLSVLVRASEDERHAVKKSLSYQGLEDDELYGNIFVFSLAGHETTANALAAAIVYLSAHPEWQDWLVEEVRQVCGQDSDSQAWEYDDKFPQLKRCFACLLETLRLTGSVSFIPKSNSDIQSIHIGGREHVIPANTFVITNVQGLHCDEKTWGADALTWRPNRWIVKGRDGSEELITPTEGSFVPWADGPRICPGKKFAQVEFVAVIAALLQKHCVQAVREAGESQETCEQRTLGMAKDSLITGITLQMRNSKIVSLAWRGRDKI